MRFYLITITLSVFLFSGHLHGQQWNAISPYPGMPTDGAFVFIIGNKAYVGGGLGENRFYSYDALANQWTRLADVPSPGTHLAWAFSFSANGKGYVAGGSYGSASDLTRNTWEYDPVGDTWTKKADFPGGNRDAGFSFSLGNKGYMGGGFDGQFLHGDLYVYDPSQDTWTKLPDFPGGPVIFPVAFVINENAYVGTGAKGGFSANEIQDIWQYNPTSNSWVRKADFAGDKRQAAIGFVVDNKGYIGGGMSGYTVIRKDFWEYDAALDSWSEVPGALFPTDSLAWSSAFVLGNEAFVGLGVDLPDFNFTNAFYKRQFSTVTAIHNEIPENRLYLYPVPVIQMVKIKSDARLQLKQVMIFDLQGRELKNLTENTREIELSFLDPGIYFMRIDTPEGSIYRKFIKQ